MGPELPEPGTILAGRYRVLDLLGKGGMASVYRAADLRHDREVALKVLSPRIGALLGSERFLREIATTARLAHPNVLPLFDSGSEAGLSWYVMPLLPGRTLKDRLLRGPLSLDEALRIFSDIASALDYAHRQGVLHRDLKPGNVLLQDDRAALADFGIALPLGAGDERLTETGFTVGTPEYMSPEQATGERDIDSRSDQYALGCVLYEMLAGAPPYTGPSAQAVLLKRLRDPVPQLGTLRQLPPGLEAAIARALRPEAADRFPSVAAFAAAVAESAGHAASSPLARHRLAVVLGSGALVGAAVLALSLLHQAHRPQLDPNIVAVLPFRVNAPGANLADWGEGMVDLLGAKLSGEGGPRAADPRTTLAVYDALAKTGTPKLGDAVASRLGAGKLLDGSIVGDAHRIVLSATITSVAAGSQGTPVSVEGTPDSILTLIDRLTILVLGRQAGEAEPSLGSLTGLPAWQAYLEGRQAWREGRADEAITAYRRALDLDSTFALAALELVPALRRTGLADSAAERRLVANLPRLNAVDSLRFYVIMGPRYPHADDVRDQLRIRERLVERLPEQADAWFELGDEQFHFGPLVDLDSSSTLARRSLNRALALDSSKAIVIVHLLLIAIEQQDTAAIPALAALHHLHDSLGVAEPFVRWRVALVRGDSATVRQVRARLSSAPGISLGFMVDLPLGDGVGLDDAILAVQALQNRAATREERDAAAAMRANLFLSLGRPGEVPPLPEPGDAIAAAMFGEADSQPALDAARVIASSRLPARAGYREWRDLFLLGCWRAAHGEIDAARRLAADLRGPLLPRARWDREIADDSLLGPALLDAWAAAAQGRPEARGLVMRLDSIASSGPATGLGPMLPLLLGRLFAALGDHERAWHALYRVPGMLLWAADQPIGQNTAIYLARARAGARAGHRDAAIRDYRLYLKLREHPDPRLVAERDSVRAELDLLLAGKGGGTS